MPQLNTTSTADISFMLLVFFLVTSSMDTDKGLRRQLAPADQQQEQQDVSRSNVMEVRLDDSDALFCDGRQVTLDELQQQVESFVASRQTDRHVIAVQTGRHTSYDAYFEMQNAVVAAYRNLRSKWATQHYGHPLSQCTPEERAAIARRYPQCISEGIALPGGGSAQEGGRP